MLSESGQNFLKAAVPRPRLGHRWQVIPLAPTRRVRLLSPRLRICVGPAAGEREGGGIWDFQATLRFEHA
jgi:hypothetical protein